MTANSANYPHETLQLALRYIDSAPPDVQKSLIFALVKEITIHHDKIDIRMYLGAPDQILQTDINDCEQQSSIKKKNPVSELIRNEVEMNEHDNGASVRPKWLPNRGTQRTINRLTIHIPIHLIFNHSNALDIVEGNAPYQISTSNRITKSLLKQFKPPVCKPNPITIAQKYKKIYDSLPVKSLETVAQQFGVTRVRVHQMINLLNLDQRIIDYLSKTTDQKKNQLLDGKKTSKTKPTPRRKSIP